MRRYTQLTHEERRQISILRKAGHRQSKVAEMLGRHKCTISRELKRNRGRRGYRPKQAHCLALTRRRSKLRPPFSGPLWDQVEALIRRDWSPEQISGRLEFEHGVRISHEWIYQYLYANKCSGGDLARHLRCQKKRRKRYGSYSRRGVIANQVSIDARPAIVAARSRVGDWEGDAVIGRGHRGALVSLVERKARYTVLAHVTRKTAAEVRQSIVDALTPHKDRVHTLTYDNGREFADHERIAHDLEAQVYFAHPYSSWERGLNENTNGLIRQYFPKHRDLMTVTAAEIQQAMHRLNHRPRKTLGYRTPYETFYKKHTSLTVALQS